MKIARWYSATVANADDNREGAFISIPAISLDDQTVLQDPQKVLSALGLKEIRRIVPAELDETVLALIAGLDPSEYDQSYLSTIGRMSSELGDFAEYLVSAEVIPVEHSPMTPASMRSLAQAAGWIALVASSSHPFLLIAEVSTGIVAFKVAEGIGDTLKELVKEFGDRAKLLIRRYIKSETPPTTVRDLKRVNRGFAEGAAALQNSGRVSKSGPLAKTVGRGEQPTKKKPKTLTIGHGDDKGRR